MQLASETTLEPKQSRSSYMACRVLHPIFGCPYCIYTFAKPADIESNFNKRRHYSWRNSRWGDRCWNSMQRICQRSKVSIDYHNIPHISMHFRENVWFQAVHLPPYCWRWLTRTTFVCNQMLKTCHFFLYTQTATNSSFISGIHYM